MFSTLNYILGRVAGIVAAAIAPDIARGAHGYPAVVADLIAEDGIVGCPRGVGFMSADGFGQTDPMDNPPIRTEDITWHGRPAVVEHHVWGTATYVNGIGHDRKLIDMTIYSNARTAANIAAQEAQ